MKTLLFASILFGFSTLSQAQTTVVYEIQSDSLVGLELTSGDICTGPFTVEEAKQISIGNMWGGRWTSTNTGTATDVVVELSFTVGDSVSSHPTSLNGTSSNMVNPGGDVNCANGPLVSWVIDPASYLSGGLNTFLVDYAGSGMINQLNNLPALGDPYIRVTVTYGSGGGGVGIDELSANKAELVKIVDLTGRETVFKPNTPLLYIYSDGSVERIYEVH